MLHDPSTAEWVAAGVAAGLVAVLSALLLLLPALRRSPATPVGRTGGLLLAIAATGLVLVVAVATAAALAAALADDVPVGPFAGVLVHGESPTTGRIAGYAAALLLPLAGVLAVLAVAVVDVGRPSGLRIAAGAGAGVLFVVGIVVALGDAGAAPTAVGWAAAVVAGGAGAALAVDELMGARHSTSSSSTMSSQRSRQSRHR